MTYSNGIIDFEDIIEIINTAGTFEKLVIALEMRTWIRA
jgi:hypothetical protein